MSEITPLIKSYLALVEFLMAAKQRLYQIGAEQGLTGMQVLTILMLDEPRPMHYFTKFFSCDPSNITGIIDALEDKGLVERKASPSDRRIKLIHLRPSGKAMRRKLIKSLTSDPEFPLNYLEDAEADDFISLVSKITDHED